MVPGLLVYACYLCFRTGLNRFMYATFIFFKEVIFFLKISSDKRLWLSIEPTFFEGVFILHNTKDCPFIFWWGRDNFDSIELPLPLREEKHISFLSLSNFITETF